MLKSLIKLLAINIVVMSSGCDKPTTLTHEFGYYNGTRTKKIIVLANDHSCSVSAFDNTVCTEQLFCIYTLPPDSHLGDPLAIPRKNCYRFLADAQANDT